MSATSTAKLHFKSVPLLQYLVRTSTRLSFVQFYQRIFGHSAGKLAALGTALALTACQAPTPPPAPLPTGPTAAEIALKQKRERAVVTLADGVKQYDAGAYDDSMKSFLFALDSATLTLPEQLTARKTMAFMHCIGGREINCKEEFEKSLALDQKFELLPAEAGHPTWGPVFKTVVIEADLRRRGIVIPPPAAKPSAAQVLQADATRAYDDGNYELAAKLFLDLQRQSITNEILVTARKFAAFSFCLVGKNSLCKAEFQKLLDSNPTFQLSPAEAGHPSWGSTFRTLTQKPRSTGGPVTPSTAVPAAPAAASVPVKK
jgi:hypothetical protein